MKKKLIVCFMLIVCIAGVTACESSGNSSESEENLLEAETDVATRELSESEQEEYNLVSNYFDIEQYEENDGRIDDNKTDKTISAIIVDDTKFEIGMSYEDVLSLGYKPEETSFADKNPSNVVISEEFINDKEGSIRLGFASRDKEDNNITVSDGSFLYEIVVYPESNTFLIDKISENSTISDIINAFGDPYRIDAGYYSDFPDMEMIYLSKELSQYLTFYVNLETEKIVAVHLEGYTE